MVTSLIFHRDRCPIFFVSWPWPIFLFSRPWPIFVVPWHWPIFLVSWPWPIFLFSWPWPIFVVPWPWPIFLVSVRAISPWRELHWYFRRMMKLSSQDAPPKVREVGTGYIYMLSQGIRISKNLHLSNSHKIKILFSWEIINYHKLYSFKTKKKKHFILFYNWNTSCTI